MVRNLGELEGFLNICIAKVFIFLSKVLHSLNHISLTSISLKAGARPPTCTLICMTFEYF